MANLTHTYTTMTDNPTRQNRFLTLPLFACISGDLESIKEKDGEILNKNPSTRHLYPIQVCNASPSFFYTYGKEFAHAPNVQRCCNELRAKTLWEK